MWYWKFVLKQIFQKQIFQELLVMILITDLYQQYF